MCEVPCVICGKPAVHTENFIATKDGAICKWKISCPHCGYEAWNGRDGSVCSNVEELRVLIEYPNEGGE